MGLTKACDHLVEPNESITERDLPKGFQYSYGQNGFRIETLVTQMVAYDTTGDNFIRRLVLVMLGPMLAPVSHTTGGRGSAECFYTRQRAICTRQRLCRV